MHLHPLLRLALCCAIAGVFAGLCALAHVPTLPAVVYLACVALVLALVFRPGVYAPPDLVLASRGREYLARWYVVTCPWFRIYLHRISSADADRHLHNHPTPWVCFVLRGGYTQELKRVAVHVDSGMPAHDYLGRYWLEDHSHTRGRVRWINRLDRLDYHRITRVWGTTWTLCVSGGRREGSAGGRWGFMVDGRHVDAEEYQG